ncbi:MAG: nickel pincer cofactor biosynthesis protein LarB [Tannerellaceae bacterium]|jgi:NCAIR mutase (PurE)-related protein|nr:nickel pincer cofactor biosynthesis protein LarB [Tannerellaceae bacterium]
MENKAIEDMGFAMLDMDRLKRTGIPEVIYGEGKTSDQICRIAARLYEKEADILITRIHADVAQAVKKIVPEAEYHALARVLLCRRNREMNEKGYIAVVAAGTSDLPVAEEAVLTASFLGNKTERVYDVGVAGLHRLFSKLDIIKQARVVIVIAGMEGALASVIGGLIDKPVIGVPTSVGYGANLGGISALLSMLNSCAAGVSVVNIDNGFGAACQASLINKL